MVENISSVRLSVDEKLSLKKNTLRGSDPNAKRISIVTGLHGDELDGQYVCFRLAQMIAANIAQLKGTVDIYPAVNPLGMESVSRAFPTTGQDVNRVFPGSEAGSIIENAAEKLIEDIKGSDICVDIHSSNIFIREIPQVRVHPDNSAHLMKYAKMLNTDLVWVHESGAVGEGSLAAALISLGIPTLVVEMGVGQRIDVGYCEQLICGIFNLMYQLGIWETEQPEVSLPMISTDGAVRVAHAAGSGIFVSAIEHNTRVAEGSLIGEIISPITGTVEQRVLAPADGIIFSLREYPIVYEGSVIARMLGV